MALCKVFVTLRKAIFKYFFYFCTVDFKLITDIEMIDNILYN